MKNRGSCPPVTGGGDPVFSPHMNRTGRIARSTHETVIETTWSLDSAAPSQIRSGIGFFDHMLEALAKHSGTSLQISCKGDLVVDTHHTTEDIGICLGQALRQALGEGRGIERYGHMGVPLDEALVIATIDLAGRPAFVSDLVLPCERLGQWETECFPEFFRALADNARIAIHLHQVCGSNGHHLAEAAFKAFARAIRQAIQITGTEIPSTKGTL